MFLLHVQKRNHRFGLLFFTNKDLLGILPAHTGINFLWILISLCFINLKPT